jgi:hypothetical protein
VTLLAALPLLLAALAALVLAASCAILALGRRWIVRLAEVEPLPPSEMPPVSIVIPARDEAHTIEPALRSVLELEGEGIEIVVVDDRSSDGTGALVERIAGGDPRLRLLTVTELPPGWLGKNHALALGASVARGELVLFTDADVRMRPDTLRRAVAHLRRRGLDHLTLGPRLEMPGAVLEAFGVLFVLLFTLWTRPWRARDPARPEHIGIGAFNLLAVSAYRAIGTHRALALRPDDDLKLGKLVKAHGFRQEFLAGGPLVSVAWYGSVGEMIRGLRKNAFAALDYRLSPLFGATLATALLFLGPPLALVVTGGWTRVLSGAAVALALLMMAAEARALGSRARVALLYPVAALLMLAAVWNAALHALYHGAIEWRGTRYSLAELRRNRI